MSEYRRYEDNLSDEERDEAIQQYLREQNMTDEELDAEILELRSRLQGVTVAGEPGAASSISAGHTDGATSTRYENFGDVPKCEHIRSNNRTCGSPALRGKRYCYFHAQLRPGGKPKKPMQLPPLEDDGSIQMAVTKICQGIVNETIEPKRATAVLYGLQVASNAVRRSATKSRS
jgi:hypothetical protein